MRFAWQPPSSTCRLNSRWRNANVLSRTSESGSRAASLRSEKLSISFDLLNQVQKFLLCQFRPVLNFAFPDNCAYEPLFAQLSQRLLVTISVGSKLFDPKGAVSSRYSSSFATSVMMPVAAVYEYCPRMTPICDIRGSRQISIARSKAQSHRKQFPSNVSLNRCIALRHAREPPRRIRVGIHLHPHFQTVPDQIGLYLFIEV